MYPKDYFWSSEMCASWAEATNAINAMELPEHCSCDNYPAEVIAKMRGQLSSAKQTAKLLLRAVSGEAVRIRIQGQVSKPFTGTAKFRDGDWVKVLVSQYGENIYCGEKLKW